MSTIISTFELQNMQEKCKKCKQTKEMEMFYSKEGKQLKTCSKCRKKDAAKRTSQCKKNAHTPFRYNRLPFQSTSLHQLHRQIHTVLQSKQTINSPFRSYCFHALLQYKQGLFDCKEYGLQIVEMIAACEGSRFRLRSQRKAKGKSMQYFEFICRLADQKNAKDCHGKIVLRFYPMEQQGDDQHKHYKISIYSQHVLCHEP